ADSRLAAAIAELQDLIRSHFPTAAFVIGEAEDPEGIYMRVIADVDDTDEVINVFLDRLVDLQVKDQLPLYVVPVRTPARIAAAQHHGLGEPSVVSLSAG
ncbi:MAG TPA: hypothetical protein VFL82_13485, partial [Thermomicrobiales bacterium]|nr:hypothetical protein [Thermomicrobiales bacterium]